MNDTIQTSVVSLAVVLVALILVGGLLYGCHEVETNYRAAQKHCVDNGGSWIAGGNGGHCIRGGR